MTLSSDRLVARQSADIAADITGMQKRADCKTMAEKVTVVVTTSPVRLNPCTAMLQQVMESLMLGSGLAACRKIIVCDGFELKTTTEGWKGKKSYRQGVIAEEHIPKYAAFKLALRELCAAATGDSPFHQCEVHELDEVQGFGYAVRAALRLVTTPYVLVVQHDRMFVRSVDMRALTECLERNSDINMISLLTRSTMAHAERMKGRFSSCVAPNCVSMEDWERFAQPRCVCGLRLVPMLQWLDSTHLARTAYYRDFVFAGGRVKKRGFIEDKLGSIMLADFRSQGWAAHAKYGTWIFDDESAQPMVAHYNGRSVITEEERNAFIAAGAAGS